MPDLIDKQMKVLLEQLQKNSIPLSLNISKEKAPYTIDSIKRYIKEYFSMIYKTKFK